MVIQDYVHTLKEPHSPLLTTWVETGEENMQLGHVYLNL